jgi:hypothetical protein
MNKHVEIEDIEEMRRCVGIEDIELREAIRGLRVGDHVMLTVRTGATSPGETLLVRITQIHGPAFRGQLAERPASSHLSGLQVGSPLKFTTSHIHSLPKGRLTDGQ